MASIKQFIYGVLKNKPKIEDLKTPNCVIKEKELRHKSQAKIDQEMVQKNQLQTLKIAQEKSLEVSHYLQSLSHSQIEELKSEFNESPSARGVKFGAEQVDFERSIVKAMFEHYVDSKYLKEA